MIYWPAVFYQADKKPHVALWWIGGVGAECKRISHSSKTDIAQNTTHCCLTASSELIAEQEAAMNTYQTIHRIVGKKRSSKNQTRMAQSERVFIV